MAGIANNINNNGRGGSNIDIQQQQDKAIKERRNCKTTSPTHNFIGSTSIINESRARKRSPKDAATVSKKKEQFADLIVIIGVKYNEFVGNLRNYNV